MKTMYVTANPRNADRARDMIETGERVTELQYELVLRDDAPLGWIYVTAYPLQSI